MSISMNGKREGGNTRVRVAPTYALQQLTLPTNICIVWGLLGRVLKQ